MSESGPAWHVGRTVGRNVYAGDGAADTVAVCVGPYPAACAQARRIVHAVNSFDALVAACKALRMQADILPCVICGGRFGHVTGCAVLLARAALAGALPAAEPGGD